MNDRSSHTREGGASVAAAGQNTNSITFSEKVWNVCQAFCCLKPQDDFVHVLRKTSASVAMVLAPVATAFGLYLIFSGYFPRDPEEKSILGLKLAGFNMFFWSLDGMVPYLYLRWRGHIPTFVMDIVMFVHAIGALLATIFWPGAMPHGLAAALSILTILSQTTYVLPLCAFITLIYTLDVFNKAYEGTDTELVIPGARCGPHAERLAVGLAVEGCVFLAIAGVFAQSVAHVKHLTASRAAVEMSRQIVNLLRRYNTEGVTEALKHYNDDVDPDLVQSLKQMNDNLETYKPFLPNYLFQDVEDFDETTSEGPLLIDTTTASEFLENISSTSTIESSSNLSVDSTQTSKVSSNNDDGSLRAQQKSSNNTNCFIGKCTTNSSSIP